MGLNKSTIFILISIHLHREFENDGNGMKIESRLELSPHDHSPFAILFSSFSKWSSKVHPWYGGWKDTRGKTCSRQEALFRIRASSVRNDTCVYHWRMYVFKNVQVTVQVWSSLCLFPKILVYGMTRQFNRS